MIVIQGLNSSGLSQADAQCPRGIGEGMRNKMQVGEVEASVFGISIEIGGVEACKNSVFVYFARPNPASALHLMVSRTRPTWSPTWTKGPGGVNFREYTAIAHKEGGRGGIIVPWEHIPNLPAPAKILVVTDWCGNELLILRQAQKASLTYNLAESRRVAADRDPIAANVLGIVNDILAGKTISQCVTPPAWMQVIPIVSSGASATAASGGSTWTRPPATRRPFDFSRPKLEVKGPPPVSVPPATSLPVAVQRPAAPQSMVPVKLTAETPEELVPLPGEEEPPLPPPDYPEEEPVKSVSTKLIVGGVVAVGLAFWLLRRKGKGLGGLGGLPLTDEQSEQIYLKPGRKKSGAYGTAWLQHKMKYGEYGIRLPHGRKAKPVVRHRDLVLRGIGPSFRLPTKGKSVSFESHGVTFTVKRLSQSTWVLKASNRKRIRFGNAAEIREDIAHAKAYGTLPQAKTGWA